MTHRQYIVNLRFIHKVIPINKSSLEIRFINFQENAILNKSLEKIFYIDFIGLKDSSEDRRKILLCDIISTVKIMYKRSLYKNYL